MFVNFVCLGAVTGLKPGTAMDLVPPTHPRDPRMYKPRENNLNGEEDTVSNLVRETIVSTDCTAIGSCASERTYNLN
ncbi:hypothetical protein BGW80DRAFT_929730 [Lactifluus volemus]|nr:hypothetical protein BGW80DRAFT_929730 [Lactifluus volemus]